MGFEGSFGHAKDDNVPKSFTRHRICWSTCDRSLSHWFRIRPLFQAIVNSSFKMAPAASLLNSTAAARRAVSPEKPRVGHTRLHIIILCVYSTEELQKRNTAYRDKEKEKSWKCRRKVHAYAHSQTHTHK